MDEAELRVELEALIRPTHERAFAVQREREERLALLSDEEWWAQFVEAHAAALPSSLPLPEEMKRQLIERRHDHLNFLNGDGLQQMIAGEVEKLMPVLLQLRRELNETGPLTNEQYHAASLRASMKQIADMSARLNASIQNAADPRKRDFMARFAGNVEQDMEDLKILSNLDLTEDHIEEVTGRINARLTDLTESFRPPEE